MESETNPYLFMTDDNIDDDGNRTTIPILQPKADLLCKKNLLLGLGDASGTPLKSGISLIVVLEITVAHRPWPADLQLLLWLNPLQVWAGVVFLCKPAILITAFVRLHGRPPSVVTRHHLSPWSHLMPT
ncbi:hypothetical protein NE237_026872 [Protea cynaroides]|uniref:Uncharacterized protein n=1 Tax=Protea cynaroides TaxID=273540 RepID=A0A9Q0GMB3_9MAGN|nr:hypothetical protein NE237_026872 [Protea cynaroides]